MSDLEINTEKLEAFAGTLHSSSRPHSHLPTILPLAFPTPLHLLNTLVTLHLVHAVLSQPSHTAYFAATSSTPADVSTRGVLGLFLSSGEAWTVDNLLSAPAWKAGKISESRITEIFGIETTQEREHETMKGIKVGGRWEEGARVMGDLKVMFEKLGSVPARCVGEVVQDMVKRHKLATESPEEFAKDFSNEAIAEIPELGASLPATGFTTISEAPLRLLQDLALRQQQSHDLDLNLYDPSQLANVSPLPLEIGPLLTTGVISIPDRLQELTSIVQDAANGQIGQSLALVKVNSADYTALQMLSINVCAKLRARRSDLSILDIVAACKERASHDNLSITVV